MESRGHEEALLASNSFVIAAFAKSIVIRS
jgi:hypothetical protein